MLRRLVELEEKVQVLETKPSEMPFDKEELLNASARRVDALEADLISTKKVGCSNHGSSTVTAEILAQTINFH